MSEMKREMNWFQYDEGFSIGTSGADVGVITRDEEHAAGARLTMEEEGSFAPFSITCNIYGWMFHTRYFSDEAEANDEFERMKTDLDQILETISGADGADDEALAAEQISEFVENNP